MRVFPIFLIDIYKKAIEDIIKHCKELAAQSIQTENPYEQNDPPWFGNIEEWFQQLLDIKFESDMLGEVKQNEIYPSCVQNYGHEIAAELGYLLPKDSPEVNAILPVLFIGYITNRRGDPEYLKRRKSKNLENYCVRNTANLLFNLLFYRDSKQISSGFNSLPNLFCTMDWDTKYSKLQFEQLNAQKLSTLKSFGTLALFLFLAHKTKALCNLTISTALFNEFTGYIDFLKEQLLPQDEELLEIEDNSMEEKIDYYITEKFFIENMDDSDSPSVYDDFILSFVAFIIRREEEKYGKDLKKYASFFKFYNKWFLLFCSRYTMLFGSDGIVNENIMDALKEQCADDESEYL